MMTAQRWYEYQDCYKKYGLDMKPKTIRTVEAAPKPAVTAKDKLRLIFLLIFIGVLCVGIIVATAYTAGVKYEVNKIAKKNAELRGEIENLNVKVEQATNIKNIEMRAIQELGMVYPASEQFVFIGSGEGQIGDFAMLLKEQAYN